MKHVFRPGSTRPQYTAAQRSLKIMMEAIIPLVSIALSQLCDFTGAVLVSVSIGSEPTEGLRLVLRTDTVDRISSIINQSFNKELCRYLPSFYIDTKLEAPTCLAKEAKCLAAPQRRGRDSNPQPADCKSDVLTTILPSHAEAITMLCKQNGRTNLEIQILVVQ